MSAASYVIEKLIHGGFGLSRDRDGKIVLIKGVLPGEEVEASVYSSTRQLKKGIATKILSPSPERVSPPCPLYHKCGGCDFQHISYPYQLQLKKQIFADLLTRSPSLLLRKAAEEQLLNPLPSPLQFHYRQRVRLHIDKNRTVGFHEWNSHRCVEVHSCLLAEEPINQCLRLLKKHPSWKQMLPCSSALEILFDPGTSSLTLIFHYARKPRPKDKSHGSRLLEDLPGVAHVLFQGDTFAMSGVDPSSPLPSLSFTLSPLVPDNGKQLKLSWEAGGFCQVNLTQNINLIKQVLDCSVPKKEETILDLFCGMGNFSIPLAHKAKSLMGLEGQGSAIRSARKNSDRAGLKNSVFKKQPIHKGCQELVEKDRRFDTLVIDPPRQGAPGLAPQLSTLCSKRLVYISCDPATLWRDLTELLEQDFSLKRLQPIDMFPQTHHIETVALLEKQ